ncbi:hypothetical protein AciPR4_3405 [Terriglobus saanensis SP1PR4]|uniref:Uncharacterized protein n=1 Tax=Terriglobus saanensis (strain ATCC BAA-1853 / DSM 23119 / SP1PR4) TaxID=401053 RepID=E8UXD5_TERSS|nr:hypothetical protein AciPR4_3405 [Terriglobus saanensis SP1PR4]
MALMNWVECKSIGVADPEWITWNQFHETLPQLWRTTAHRTFGA